MQIDIDPENLKTGNVDGQGRKYLGSEYAGKKVTVAIVEVKDE